MANTYTQIYLHVVFAVSARACVISPARREELQKYITGIVTRKGQKLIAVYSMPDHTHVLLGLKPNIAPSELIGDIKTGSTNHINERKWIGATGRFRSPIRIWIASSDIFVVSPRIIAESLFNANIWNFWSDITSHTMSVIFSSR